MHALSDHALANRALYNRALSIFTLSIMHFLIMHFPIMHFVIVHFPIMHFPIMHFEFNSLFIHALIKIIVYLKDIHVLCDRALSILTVLSNLTPSATKVQNSEITQPLSET